MDTAKWPQEFVVKPTNEIVTNTTTTCFKHPNPNPTTVENNNRKARPEKDQALNCPRCNSLNTKFCYYNNYSLTQPRYFCKDCRRYWTEGGSLRNIPIGGGVRKNKRSSSNSSSNSNSSSSPSSSSSKKPLYTPQLNPSKIAENAHESKVQDLAFSSQAFGNTNVVHEAKDLNLAFSSQGFGIGQIHHHLHPQHHHHQSIPEFLQVVPSTNNPLVSTSSALELLGISSSNNSRPPPPPPFLPFTIPNPQDYNTEAARDMGFGMSYPQFQDFMRPTSALGFSLDNGGGGYGGDHSLHQEKGSTNNNGRPLLPFESLKLPVSSSSTNSGGNGNDNNQNQQSEDNEKESVGFWSGMLSAGGAASSATVSAGATTGTTGTASWQ